MTEKHKKNAFASRNFGFLRKSRGDTQEDLAIFLGVTPKQISNYERGVTSFSLELAEIICKKYGVSLDSFAKTDLSNFFESSELPPSVDTTTEGGEKEPGLSEILREIVRDEMRGELLKMFKK